jgi:hypothetical protein
MELGGMAPTLKQTIQDRISKGNIHVENDEASTSEQTSRWNGKEGRQEKALLCHNRKKRRGGRRARQRAIKRKLAQTPKQPKITHKWVPKEHEESVVTVNMVGKAEKEGQNGPRNRFRHPSCSVV